MSSFLKFLSNVTVENVEAKAGNPGGAKKQRNPNPMFLGFRIWADGSVYPSKAMVDRFNLEYPNATVSVVKKSDNTDKKVFTVVGNQGNGLDVIDTRKWSQVKTELPFIAIAIAEKNSPKIDLFGMTRYTEEGTPTTSVLDQGTATFGESTLLPLIKELYGTEPNGEGFIDMEVGVPEAGGVNLRSSNNIELLPKVISRGADKGKPDYIRRENVDIFMICPAEVATQPELPGLNTTLTDEAGVDASAVTSDTLANVEA